jgi:aminomethyltransferase
MLNGKRAARQGASILDADSRTVGVVTSGSFSPTLDRPIAMAYVEPSVASEQSMLDIDIRGSRVSATIVPLPFYKRASST